jgi:23S rRNA pseudouridine2605 synthase
MRDRPHPNHKLEWPGGVVPEWARPKRNPNKRFGKKGPGGKGGAGAKRERLQKVMAQSGYGSRRNIEILIAQGHITINGEAAKLGDQVGPGDKVKLDGNVINLRFGGQMPRVLLYHKPDNEIVTRDDPENRATVFDKLPKVNGGRWVSIGRLDLNTSGLLMFTTNGDLANKMTHPRFEVEREYAVRVMGEITEEVAQKLLKTGVDIEGEVCTFDSIEDRGGEGSNHWYHVVLREGKNREVRKMMEAVGLMVSRLMRVRFGSVQLPGFLKRGMWREMDEDQVSELLAFAGMSESDSEVEEGAEEEEDEGDNIGNRYDAAREARKQRPEPADDIGNRYDAAREARQRVAEPDDDIGNRGTYGEGFRPPKEPDGRPQGHHPRGDRQPGGKKGFFKKPRTERNGNVAHPPSHHAAGPGHGNGNGNGQAHGHGQPHGGKRRKHGKPQGHAQGQQPHGGNANAAQPHAPRTPGGAPHPQGATPGPAKPHRNRRNKNRNKPRGAEPA